MTPHTPTPPDDEFTRLLHAARAGSVEALGKAFRACERYLWHVGRLRLGPDLTAKGGASDLVQDTFLEAQRAFPNFQGTTGDEFLAWLCRILLNNVKNFRRRHSGTQKRQAAAEVSLSEPTAAAQVRRKVVTLMPSPVELAIRREEERRMTEAVERLPDSYREVVRLRWRERQSFAQIGGRLGCSEEAARKLWVRALHHVAELVYAGDPDRPAPERR